MAISVSPNSFSLAVSAYQDITVSGGTANRIFVDVPVGSGLCTVAQQSATVWRVTRTGAGTINVRFSDGPSFVGRDVNDNDGDTILLEDARLQVLTGHADHNYLSNFATGNGLVHSVVLWGVPRLRIIDGNTGITYFDINNGGYTAGSGDLIEFKEVAGLMEYWLNGAKITDTTAPAGGNYYLNLTIFSSIAVGYQPRFNVNEANASTYTEDIAVITDPPTNTTQTQTLDGTARIQKTVTQTVTGISRIQKTVSQTLNGTASIRKTTTQTLTGTARIQGPHVEQTITGTASIRNTTTRTVSGQARIQNTASQTLSGTARIQKTAVQTLTGTARVQKTVSQTINGLSRVQKSAAQTLTGTARIYATTLQTIAGRASIRKTTTRTITGTARIYVPQTVHLPLSVSLIDDGVTFVTLRD